MEFDPNAISPHPAELPYAALYKMRRLVRALFRLQQAPAYLEALNPVLPETARFDPGHDAVMMGYDFHLDDSGAPHLIEVNTNAGGAIYAYKAAFPEARPDHPLPGAFPGRFSASFLADFRRFRQDPGAQLKRLVILDDQPEEQNLYPEMVFFRDYFRQQGIACEIADPGELQAGADGVFLGGSPVEMIYNRHCDFYLETPALAGLRTAYLKRSVCLSPNPRAYGLLADKRRLLLFGDADLMARCGLSRRARQLLQDVVPPCRLLQDWDPEEAWQERSDLVFKPVSMFGGKGVLMGKSMSRKRFHDLDPTETLVQKFVPPSMNDGGSDGELKTDYRLFVYRSRLIGASARLYRGQLTNLRTPGGGFARVRITREG